MTKNSEKATKRDGEVSFITSYQLNAHVLAGIRTCLTIGRMSTQVAVVQIAVEMLVNRLPELFPLISAAEVQATREREFQKLISGPRRPGRLKKTAD